MGFAVGCITKELVDIKLVLSAESSSERVSTALVGSLDVTLLDSPPEGDPSFVPIDHMLGTVFVANDSHIEIVVSKTTVEMVSLIVASMVAVHGTEILNEVPSMLVNNAPGLTVVYIIAVSMLVSGKDVEPDSSDRSCRSYRKGCWLADTTAPSIKGGKSLRSFMEKRNVGARGLLKYTYRVF